MTRSRVTLKCVSTIDIVLSRRFDVLFLLFFKAGPYVGGEHITTAGFEPAISSTSFILGIDPSLQAESLFSGEFPILHVVLG